MSVIIMESASIQDLPLFDTRGPCSAVVVHGCCLIIGTGISFILSMINTQKIVRHVLYATTNILLRLLLGAFDGF